MSNITSVKDEWIYKVFRADCLNPFDLSCWRVTIGMTLYYLSLIMILFQKFPQVMKMIRKKTHDGVSRAAYYLETVNLLQTTAFYNWNGTPLKVYWHF